MDTLLVWAGATSSARRRLPASADRARASVAMRAWLACLRGLPGRRCQV